MTLSVQSSAGRFHSAQGYPAIHALSPSGLISVQLQPVSYQLHITMRGQGRHFKHSCKKKEKENSIKMNRFFFRYSVDVMRKRSTKGSNNNKVVNHYIHAPLEWNFSFYWFFNTFCQHMALRCREELRPEWREKPAEKKYILFSIIKWLLKIKFCETF